MKVMTHTASLVLRQNLVEDKDHTAQTLQAYFDITLDLFQLACLKIQKGHLPSTCPTLWSTSAVACHCFLHNNFNFATRNGEPLITK